MSRKHKQAAASTDWRNGFLFIGNHVALDLVNTALVIRGKRTELIPDFSALLGWFRAARLLSDDDAMRLENRWARSREAAQIVVTIRRLREMLRQEVLRREAGSSLRPAVLQTVNRLLAKHPMRVRLRKTLAHPRIEAYFTTGRPGNLLAPLADAAARLFAEIPAERVRKCANCVAHFYDNSKKGNRRWCSMQICGNREKVAAYAARHRGARGPQIGSAGG